MGRLSYQSWTRLIAFANAELAGLRLQKIQHQDEGDLVLELFGPGGRRWVRFCAGALGARFYISFEPITKTPHQADAFTRDLRKRLLPGRVTGVRLRNEDKVVEIQLGRPDDSFLLVLEAFGNRPNLLLLDAQETILFRYQRGTAQRPCKLGDTYEDPPPLEGVSRDVETEEHASLSDRDLNLSLAEQFRVQDEDQRRSDIRRLLRGSLMRDLKRLRRKKKAIAAQLENLPEPENVRARANVLAAQLHRVVKGSDTVVLNNVGQEGLPDEVTIELDPRRSPQDNLNRMYRRATRADRTLKHAERQTVELNAQMAALEARLEAIERGDFDDQPPPPAKKQKRKRADGKAKTDLDRVAIVHEFGAIKILIGRNAESNDELLRRYARGNDLWFHVRDGAGSHVLLKCQSGRPKQEDIYRAAWFAARHSSLKTDALVDVMWTECKNVRKAKGAPAGQVTVRNNHTIQVRTEDRIS